MTYALILAGGSGTRFWPLSRNATPKQLLDLFGDGTLLKKTVDRLEGLVPKENVLILTNAAQESAVRAALPDLPAENILAEPAKRDTAPAVALGIGWVAARDPEATMIVLPADQLIPDAEEYRRVIAGTVELAASTSALVTVGIKPTWPCPSYGYIERGDRHSTSRLTEKIAAYEVTRFREKPNPELAEKFLESGAFTWNAGMFIWSIPTVISELTLHCPQLAEFVHEIRKSKDIPATLAKQFPKLTPTSIDYALMECATHVLNVEASFEWDDVGSWVSVGKYLPEDEKGNRHNTPITVEESTGNTVYSAPAENGKHPHVALLGVHDLVVVHTADGILVANKFQADQIKKLVDQLPEELC